MRPDELFATNSDREEYERAEREHRWGTTPMALHVNCATGEMISPSGQIDDETIAEMERKHREGLDR